MAIAAQNCRNYFSVVQRILVEHSIFRQIYFSNWMKLYVISLALDSKQTESIFLNALFKHPFCFVFNFVWFGQILGIPQSFNKDIFRIGFSFLLSNAIERVQNKTIGNRKTNQTLTIVRTLEVSLWLEQITMHKPSEHKSFQLYLFILLIGFIMKCVKNINEKQSM